MSDHERMTLLDIMSGHSPMHDILFLLCYMKEHMATARYLAGITWLKQNKIKGQKFVDFYVVDCHRSPLELIRQITKHIEHEKTTRPMLYGLDIVS